MPIHSYILATAGHVDHGKSALVRALTGTDPDRLPEEKARGITIDLGFAYLELPSATMPNTTLQIGIIDVPGHEDFIKNMAAGMGAVDAALLVVATDDTWMPQTEEHLHILTYLGVRNAIVALTKVDLAVDAAQRVESIRQRLRNTPFESAPIIPTSTVTGQGLEALKLAIANMLSAIPPRPDLDRPRLAIDRAFSLKGIGTVVTGSLLGGCIHTGDALTIQPAGIPVHARSIQTHHCRVETALPGSRVALNLPELPLQTPAASRGQVVTRADSGGPTRLIEAFLHRLNRGTGKNLRHGSKVHLHLGTAEVPATVLLFEGPQLNPGNHAFARIRVAEPLFTLPGDRFILRDWPARETLAGGIVLDATPRPTGFRQPHRMAFLRARATNPTDPETLILSQLKRDGATLLEPLQRHLPTGPAITNQVVQDLLNRNLATRAGPYLVETERWQAAKTAATSALGRYHQAHPELPGMKRAALEEAIHTVFPAAAIFEPLLLQLCQTECELRHGDVALRIHRPTVPSRLEPAITRLRKMLSAKPFEPPSRSQLPSDHLTRQGLQFLLDTGEVLAVGADIVMTAHHVAAAREKIQTHLHQNGPATVSDLKQALGSTRRVMVPLMEYLDKEGLTLRKGDLRELRPQGVST